MAGFQASPEIVKCQTEEERQRQDDEGCADQTGLGCGLHVVVVCVVDG